MAEIDAEARRIIDEPNLAHFVTLMKDGSPQVTPVWVDHDGTHIIINTAEGRQKPRNLRRDPRVALSVVDRERTNHYVQIRGRVVEVTTEGAWESINKLSQKYSGRAYGGRADEQRIIVKILPEHVSVRG